MGNQASVESFEALCSLRMALSKFADHAAGVLYAAEADLQRGRTWVKTEQVNHWQAEGRKRAELLIRAKLALKEKKLTPTPLGGRQSTVEEEKALKLATRRMEEAEQKAINVKQWGRRIDEEAHNFQGWAAGMKRAVTAEIPAAIAKLDNMLAALEAYAMPAAPQLQTSVAFTTPPDETAARKNQDAPTDHQSRQPPESEESQQTKGGPP